jgi:3-amino-4-hydroxybenzoic acid synthase
VFPLPYMEMRPFRINAGGVHSYIFGPDERTQYLSELRSGQSCLVVDVAGETRIAPLGRVKIEVRPLRLVSCIFGSGEQIGIIMQDDWHVRVFGADASARNLTELRPGDEVMAYRALPGRHVGIQVSEFIEER